MPKEYSNKKIKRENTSQVRDTSQTDKVKNANQSGRYTHMSGYKIHQSKSTQSTLRPVTKKNTLPTVSIENYLQLKLFRQEKAKSVVNHGVKSFTKKYDSLVKNATSGFVRKNKNNYEAKSRGVSSKVQNNKDAKVTMPTKSLVKQRGSSAQQNPYQKGSAFTGARGIVSNKSNTYAKRTKRLLRDGFKATALSGSRLVRNNPSQGLLKSHSGSYTTKKSDVYNSYSGVNFGQNTYEVGSEEFTFNNSIKRQFPQLQEGFNQDIRYVRSASRLLSMLQADALGNAHGRDIADETESRTMRHRYERIVQSAKSPKRYSKQYKSYLKLKKAHVEHERLVKALRENRVEARILKQMQKQDSPLKKAGSALVSKHVNKSIFRKKERLKRQREALTKKTNKFNSKNKLVSPKNTAKESLVKKHAHNPRVVNLKEVPKYKPSALVVSIGGVYVKETVLELDELKEVNELRRAYQNTKRAANVSIKLTKSGVKGFKSLASRMRLKNLVRSWNDIKTGKFWKSAAKNVLGSFKKIPSMLFQGLKQYILFPLVAFFIVALFSIILVAGLSDGVIQKAQKWLQERQAVLAAQIYDATGHAGSYDGPIVDIPAGTPIQEAVYKMAMSGNSFGKGPGQCQAWVRLAHAKAGNGMYYAATANEAWAKWKHSGSTNLSHIPVGANVYGSGSGSAGHVGIYVGNGMVAHMSGDGYQVVSMKYFSSWQKVYGWCWQGGKAPSGLTS